MSLGLRVVDLRKVVEKCKNVLVRAFLSFDYLRKFPLVKIVEIIARVMIKAVSGDPAGENLVARSCSSACLANP